MTRIILKGMDHDNTRTNYFAKEDYIPEKATSIRVSFGDYTLKLMGKLTQNGVLRNFNIKNTLEFKIDYIPVGGPESIQTIITEDGKVYSRASKERFETMLKDLRLAGGFNSTFNQIKENPSKFYHFN